MRAAPGFPEGHFPAQYVPRYKRLINRLARLISKLSNSQDLPAEQPPDGCGVLLEQAGERPRVRPAVRDSASRTGRLERSRKEMANSPASECRRAGTGAAPSRWLPN